jgi:hypothetical protein
MATKRRKAPLGAAYEVVPMLWFQGVSDCSTNCASCSDDYDFHRISTDASDDTKPIALLRLQRVVHGNSPKWLFLFPQLGSS